jgi:hypothetical protein
VTSLTTSSCTASHCLCVIGNDMAIATTSTQDCPEHGEDGYHPDVVMWDCHEPDSTAYCREAVEEDR